MATTGGESAAIQSYKIILVGDATVGKTHLLARYTRGSLPKHPNSTVGVEFATHTVPLAVGGTVKVNIWDTAGQERYRSITNAHYRRAVGALLVYDVTRKNTFLNAGKWLDDLRTNAEPDIVVMLVGNKVDLAEGNPHERQVPTAMAAQYAQKNGIFFSEVSAVSSFNVKRVFETLVQEIYTQKNQNGGGDSTTASPQTLDLVPSTGLRIADGGNESANNAEGCCAKG